jgi:alpha-L-fucosidase
MSRRSSFSLVQALIAILTCLLNVGALPENFVDVKPSPQQVAWQDLEFVIIHFSTNTFLDREWGDGTVDPKLFHPNFDAEQWVCAIQAAGAKYVVVMAKHHDGFCLWPTRQSDYSLKASPWKMAKATWSCKYRKQPGNTD